LKNHSSTPILEHMPAGEEKQDRVLGMVRVPGIFATGGVGWFKYLSLSGELSSIEFVNKPKTLNLRRKRPVLVGVIFVNKGDEPLIVKCLFNRKS